MNGREAPRIFVDADACPVRGETERVAERRGLRLFIVSNGGIRPSTRELTETVFVDAGADAADDWIAARVRPGDVCVTADVPLAARVVAAGALAIGPDGEAFTAANIGSRVATRDLMAELRAADPLAATVRGGGKAFSRADRARFLDRLDALLRG